MRHSALLRIPGPFVTRAASALAVLVVWLAQVAAIGQPAAIAANPQPAWTEPVQIGADLSTSWFPEIHVDIAGRVHVVWDAGVPAQQPESESDVTAVMSAELTSSGATTPGDILLGQDGYASRPIITSDDSWAYLLYRKEDMYVSRAPLSAPLDDARSWSTPFRLSSNESYWGQIVALPGGTVIVFFSQLSPVMVENELESRMTLFARRSSDGGQTWGQPERLSLSGERVGRSSATVGRDGSIYLTWDEGYDHLTGEGDPTRIVTLVSADGGLNWERRNAFEGSFDQSVIAVSGTTAVLIYRSLDSNTLHYRLSADGGATWSDEQRSANLRLGSVPVKHNFDRLSVAVDGNGVIFVAFVGEDLDAPAGASVMVASFTGTGWTDPVIVGSPAGTPEYPRIAIAAGNQFFLVYFERDDTGHRLWTSSGQSDAAAIPTGQYSEVAIPTAAAAASRTIDLAPYPTPPSIPAVVAIDGGSVHSPQSQVFAPVRTALVATIGTLLVTVPVLGAALLLKRAHG